MPFVRAQHPDGRTWTDFTLIYEHIFPPAGQQLWTWAREGAIDVLLFNLGVHYLLEPPRHARAKGNVSSYIAHMSEMYSRAAAMMRAHPHTLVLFQQSVAQHFGCKSSYFNDAQPKDTRSTCSGDWDSRDRTRYFLNRDAVALASAPIARPDCQCYEFEAPGKDDWTMLAMRTKVSRDLESLDLSVGWRNALAMDILARDFASEPIGVVHWFEITRTRSQYHRMSCCTSIKSTCDCTHYCYNEVMYHEGFAELHRAITAAQPRLQHLDRFGLTSRMRQQAV